ncbi:MAG: hypothetical protein ACJ8MR_07545 [Povalibacter sp.]
MTRTLDIEAKLDRSLANQVKAPQLDHRFDAAVWARIEAAEQRTTNPVLARTGPSSGRWLHISNVVGVAVSVVLVGIFGIQFLADISMTMPTLEMSTAVSQQIITIVAVTTTVVSVVFGLLFTPLGRRLRAELT